MSRLTRPGLFGAPSAPAWSEPSRCNTSVLADISAGGRGRAARNATMIELVRARILAWSNSRRESITQIAYDLIAPAGPPGMRRVPVAP